MSATANDRPTPRRDAEQFAFPVAAATNIPAGVMVAINASGLAVNALTSTAIKCAGVSEARADNSAGAASAINVKVRRGCHRFGNSAAADLITLYSIGLPCYVVDNQTVALTSASSTRSVAGTVRDVDADGVWVDF